MKELIIKITKEEVGGKDIMESHIDGDLELIKELQHIPVVRKECEMDMREETRDMILKTLNIDKTNDK